MMEEKNHRNRKSTSYASTRCPALPLVRYCHCHAARHFLSSWRIWLILKPLRLLRLGEGSNDCCRNKLAPRNTADDPILSATCLVLLQYAENIPTRACTLGFCGGQPRSRDSPVENTLMSGIFFKTIDDNNVHDTRNDSIV